MTDQYYMRRALTLAERGMGWVSPNPMVGAVLVKDGAIIAEGWHHKCGDLHAERDALRNCTADPSGATMYVTLEPCCHHGRQPPCVNAILEAGIKRVVVGSGDPNPLVAGKGISILRAHGVEVTEHIEEDACLALNRVFFHYIRTKTPYVVLKYAMTLDGHIATYTGASKWITGEAARAHVHTQRHRFRAIMVGVGTVLADNPLLTCRTPNGRNPIRVICDTHLRTPHNAQVVQTAQDVPTILATCVDEQATLAPYLAAGCEVITLPLVNGHVDVSALMVELGKREIDSVLLEGGGTLNWSFVQAGLVNYVQAYIAPKLFGGQAAKSPIEGQGFATPADALHLQTLQYTPLGDDILLEGEVKH